MLGVVLEEVVLAKKACMYTDRNYFKTSGLWLNIVLSILTLVMLVKVLLEKAGIMFSMERKGKENNLSSIPLIILYTI